jgi:hypothetical protein
MLMLPWYQAINDMLSLHNEFWGKVGVENVYLFIVHSFSVQYSVVSRYVEICNSVHKLICASDKRCTIMLHNERGVEYFFHTLVRF